MSEKSRRQQWLKFIIRIIMPTLLAIIVSIVSIYIVIIPSFKDSFLDGKREMIRELANVAWSIMDLYEQEALAGRMTRVRAQEMAAAEIENLRYGAELKDYFWISDMQPKLIMHPYSKELVGTDLSTYEDSSGKKVFMEIKAAVESRQSGFIDYIWSKKYTTEQDVSKLSYVKKYEPWGWVVGTGVFLDDVEIKTRRITNRLTQMIYVSVIVFTLLLLYVTRQSMKIERKRREAEENLELSRIKYKTLVESAVDPIMMIHKGSCIYANRGMEALAGYSLQELEKLVLTGLFPEMETIDGKGVFTQVADGSVDSWTGEVLMLRKDGMRVEVEVSMSRKDLGNLEVLVLTARDISTHKQIEVQLDESREKYRLLTNRLHIGVFRTSAENGFRIIEANPIAVELLGFNNDEELLERNLLDIIGDDAGQAQLFQTLQEEGYVKEQLCSLRLGDGRSRTVSISMVLTKNSVGQPLYCDGLIDDISHQQKTALERENLIVELQTSLMFLNQPVKTSLTELLACDMTTPISRAAEMMTAAKKSSILVKSESGTMIGIVTDVVLRERVIAGNLSSELPVYQIMSSPLIYIEDSALIFEAVLLLQERGIKHLAVKDGSGSIVSVISNEELLDVHRYSAAFLIEDVRKAESVAEISAAYKRLPRIVKALIDSGAHAKNITRIITTVADEILGKLIDFTIEEMGEPPATFSFVSLGSEGRGEQTLVTDQDNALIFEDVPEEKMQMVRDYFKEFGTKICTRLNDVGYAFCSGNVMAMNPQWCQPISVWKNYFSKWIAESSPEDLMEASIFFDFRCLYGSSGLVDDLRGHIASRQENRAGFLYQLVQNTLLFKIPIDFFGKIAFETGGEHPDTFNIKHVISQIVGFARIYAIQYFIESTNTLQRLDVLRDKGVLNRAAHEEIVEAYNYLMQLRFRHQVKMIELRAKPDNHINKRELSHMEKDMLEKICSQVNGLRKRFESYGRQ